MLLQQNDSKEPHLFALTFFNAYCVMKTYELIGTYRDVANFIYLLGL